MAYESFYGGTPYTLEPAYSSKESHGDTFIGYRVPFKRIGAPTSIQTANQIQEVSNLLNQGLRHIELQALNPEIFDTIPKQHFKEMARLQKMSGAETSIHAPVLEPSGIGKEGWSEADRVSVEQQLNEVVDKVQELNPKGGMPIVIHASAIQGSEESPISDELKKQYVNQFKTRHGQEPTKEEIDGLKYKRIVAINQDTKQMIPIEREERIYPREVIGKELKDIKPTIRSPMEELDIHNQSEWHQKLTQVVFYKNRGDELIQQYYSGAKDLWRPIFGDPRIPEEKKEEIRQALPKEKRAAIDNSRLAYEYVQQSSLEMNSLFSRAYKYGTEKEKEILVRAAKEYTEKMGSRDLAIQSQAIQELAIKMENTIPKTFVPIEEFATNKSAETFANVAWQAYSKNKKNPPIISVENLFPGMAFSRSEQLKGLIEETRKKFQDNAIKNGYTRDEAKKIGEKVIGATWDVGHLNMQRKSGFQEKDLIAETKNIAPFVKHVHLTDNFGYSDSHLPPGMGNVPIKGILQELEKKGFAGKEVVEAGNFAAQFKVSPTQPTLEALGSPLYAMKQAPYWNQISTTQGSYFSGYGPIFPEQHFSMYGSGFSGMPVELGGQIAGKQSRFSGTPSE